MKRDYDTILDDADSANRVSLVPSLRVLHDALRETLIFSWWPKTKCKLLNYTETSFTRALITNNCHFSVRQGRKKKKRKEGGRKKCGKFCLFSTFTQIPNHKTSKKTTKANSNVNKLRQGKLREITKCSMFANPVFTNPSRYLVHSTEMYAHSNFQGVIITPVVGLI